ncbi:MAG: desulfoferrodoxin [Planctomycetaceae bacterium]|nr:desulfoferrodoxin [Planctomycetaceae bacterium]
MAEIRGVYVCEKCGNIVEVLAGGAGILACCGSAMVQQKENTVDAAVEKHIPVVTVEGNKMTVQVGSTLHPMTADHWIEWIEVFEDNKLKRAVLKPGDEPKAEFCTNGGDYTVRAYCNLHGLWKNQE